MKLTLKNTNQLIKGVRPLTEVRKNSGMTKTSRQ